MEADKGLNVNKGYLTVGKTPLVRDGRAWAKLECTNPIGSIKETESTF